MLKTSDKHEDDFILNSKTVNVSKAVIVQTEYCTKDEHNYLTRKNQIYRIVNS